MKNNIKTLKQLRDAIETDLNENNFSNEIRNDDMITADIKKDLSEKQETSSSLSTQIIGSDANIRQ